MTTEDKDDIQIGIAELRKQEDKKERIKQITKDAWLNLGDIDENDLFNPMDFVMNSDEDFNLRLAYIMSRPEYFSFICKEVLNIQLLPTQCLFLEEIWVRKFPMLIATRGFGKSYGLALYALLRALLLDGRKIVIVGSAFRQSKILFEYIETMWRNSPLLRTMCDERSGPKRENDRCIMRVNDSVITCLPLGDGQKIRGQRAHDIIADEFACLEKGSIVETLDGFVRIEDFEQHRIITGDDKCPVEFPEKYIKTPLTDVYEIKLKNGYVIRSSKQHKVMTNKGWKHPLELTDSSYIEKSNNRTHFSKISPVYITNELSWLIGILVSEGSITDKKRISVTTTDINLCSKLVNLFGFKFNVVEEHIDNSKKAYKLYLDDEVLRTKLYSLGLDYITSHDKIVPKCILESTVDNIWCFLSGLFEGDGSCFLWEDGDVKNRIGLAYYSVSERLCRDVQFLMDRLGYDGYINSRKSEISDNLQWFVRWDGNKAREAAVVLNVDRFKEAINNCCDIVEPTYITWDKFRNKWKVQYDLCGKKIQKRFRNEIDAENFVFDLKEKDIYRKVVSVTKLDKQQNLYDYYLPITNSFYAEGHRQHNSIPRDIFENVVAGFGVVSSNPINNVQKEASKKIMEELGFTLEDEQTDTVGNSVANQIILSGTAYYEFNHFAEYWKKWKAIINSRGNPTKVREVFSGEEPPENFYWGDYSIIRMPYELVPKGFMDADQISRSKATVHSGIYQMEFGAVFTRDSQGFFKMSLITGCVPSLNNVLKTSDDKEIRFEAMLLGDPKKRYVMGVDPASEVDNFSIVLIELNNGYRSIVHCWTTSRSQHKDLERSGYTNENDFYAYCARKIRDLMARFPVIHISLDAQGGGIAVMEALHDKRNLGEGELPIWPTINHDEPKDTDGERGLHILEMCQFAKYEWLSEANHGMKKDFEDKKLLFPYSDGSTLGLATADDQIKGRAYDTLEDCILDIEELKNELSIIEISQTPAGRDKWDTPEVIVGIGKKRRIRKDRYSGLVMANMASRQIENAPPSVNAGFYGGFANTKTKNSKEKKTGNLYNGPSWFTEAMKGVY